MLRRYLCLIGLLCVAPACFETTAPPPEGEDESSVDEDDDEPGPGDDDDDDEPAGSGDDAPTTRRDASTGSSPRLDGGSGRDGSTTLLDASTDKPAGDGATATPRSDGGATPSTVGVAKARSITVGGAARNYLLYVPSSLAGARKPAPFVGVFHGFTMSGKVMEDLTSWKAVAEREKFVVAFPDGGGPSPWNVGEGVCNVGAFVAAPGTQDDFAFLKAMIMDADSQQAVDEEHAFVAGFSMGGYFANNVGCKARELVRAVAAHSGGTYMGDCPGDPVPVLIVHGDSDTLIPFDCGKAAHGYWLTRNGCTGGAKSEPIEMGTCEWAEGCPKDREVGICTLKGMDHGWAGAKFTGPWLTLQYGGGEQFEDAAEMMWKFFARYL